MKGILLVVVACLAMTLAVGCAASYQPIPSRTSNLKTVLNACTDPEACVQFGHEQGYTDVEMSAITKNPVILEYLYAQGTYQPRGDKTRYLKAVLDTCNDAQACVQFGRDHGYSDSEMRAITKNPVILAYLSGRPAP
jgi:hypothetical protein